MQLFDSDKNEQKQTKSLRPRWTKEEIKEVIKLWDDHTIEEISRLINRTPTGIQNVAHDIRKLGITLKAKSWTSGAPRLQETVQRALEELGVKTNKS